MKTAVIENNKIVVKELSDVKLNGRKGAVVQVLGCGLCGSDIVKFVQKLSKSGAVLGHEIVARIKEIDSDTGFKAGDEIVSSHHVPCNECKYCKSGNVSMCEYFKTTNIEPGGFSELVFLSDEHLKNMAYLKPENLSYDEASFYEPLGCCVRAIKRARLSKNSKVLVVGLGSIGLLMAQALKAYGMQVIGCDLLKERIELLEKYGIEAHNVSELKSDMEADAIFMTSGSDKAIDTALMCIRDGGTILVFASTPLNNGYANNEIYYRELTVLGSYSPAPEDLKDSLVLLKSGKVDVKGLSTIYNMEDINKAFEDTINNRVFKAYIRIKE